MSLISTMLESVCSIQRPTSVTRDSASGVVQVFTTIASNLPCSQQEASASVIMLYSQRNASVTTTIYFAQDPKTEPNDRISCVDRNGVATWYLVEGEAQVAAGRGRLWSVGATRIRPPQ